MARSLTTIALAAVLLLALVKLTGCSALLKGSAESSAEDANAAADCAEKNARGTDAAKNARAAADRAGRAATVALNLPGAGSSDVDADPRVRAAAADLADAEAAAKRAADAQHRAETAASIADYDMKEVMRTGEALANSRTNATLANLQLERAEAEQIAAVKAYRKVADSQFHSNTELRAVAEEVRRTGEALANSRTPAALANLQLERDEAAAKAAVKAYQESSDDPGDIKRRAADAKKEADARAADVADAKAKLAQAREETAADVANAAADEAGRAAESIAKCRDVVQKTQPVRLGQDLFGSQGGRRVPGPGGGGGGHPAGGGGGGGGGGPEGP